MTEYITKDEAISAIHTGFWTDIRIDKNIKDIPAARVVEVVLCHECKYGTPLKAHADGVYGLHCAIGRGEEVRNVWHKYSKHYEDYSIVDVCGYCDQGEAGESAKEGIANA